MTNAAVSVDLRLRLQDQATAGLDKAAARAAENERKVALASEQSAQRQRSSQERASQAREALSTRSAKRLQDEISNTQRAYDAQAKAGFANAQDQARALDATRAKVAALTHELGRLTAAQQQQQSKQRGPAGVPPSGERRPPVVPAAAPPATVPAAPPPGGRRPTTAPPAVPPGGGRSAPDGTDRASQAREALGVRSEKRIQEEIKATQRAYGALAAAGFSSAQEQARYMDATRAKVTALTNELGRLTAAQQKQAAAARGQERMGKAVQVGGAVVAGAAAGSYAMQGAQQHAMAVDERLAHLANTAYRERDARGKRAGMGEMRDAVDSATNKFGGTRAGATGALEELMASGAMRSDEAIKMLPSLVKAATAANADPTQLAQIGIRAMQTFRVKADDMPNVLNMALAAGQAGGFELKDMAKWLPQQMAAGTMSGLSGRAGFAKLAALNQAAAITAGTKDEAGNNVVNLLAKINSADTAKDAQKMGVNLPRYLQERRAKGVDSVDAFGELVNKAVQGRDDYKALQKQLAGAKGDDEKRATLDSMTTIAQGAGVGKLIQDRQALMALLGMMNNREYMGRVLTEVKSSDRAEGGAVDNNFELIAGTGAYKARRRGENVQAAQDRVLGDGGSVMGALNTGVADVAAKFPLLSGATVTATSAIAAMAGAAGLASMALGGRGGAGAAGGVPGGPAAKGGAIAGAAMRAAPYLAQGGKLLARGGVAGAAAGLGGMAVDAVTNEGSAANRYGSAAVNGAALGGALGSLVPVLGTAVGAGVGALGGLAVQGVRDMFKSAEPPRLQGEIKVSVSDDRVSVSQQLKATGMDATLTSGAGNIWAGAPL